MGFSVGQASGPLGEVVEGKVEGVKDGAANGGDLGVGAAEPGLDGRGGDWRAAQWEILAIRICAWGGKLSGRRGGVLSHIWRDEAA